MGKSRGGSDTYDSSAPPSSPRSTKSTMAAGKEKWNAVILMLLTALSQSPPDVPRQRILWRKFLFGGDINLIGNDANKEHPEDDDDITGTHVRLPRRIPGELGGMAKTFGEGRINGTSAAEKDGVLQCLLGLQTISRLPAVDAHKTAEKHKLEPTMAESIARLVGGTGDQTDAAMGGLVAALGSDSMKWIATKMNIQRDVLLGILEVGRRVVENASEAETGSSIRKTLDYVLDKSEKNVSAEGKHRFEHLLNLMASNDPDAVRTSARNILITYFDHEMSLDPKATPHYAKLKEKAFMSELEDCCVWSRGEVQRVAMNV